MTPTEDQTQRIYCNECRQATNHRRVGQHGRSVHDNDPLEYVYNLWVCAGCEAGTLEVLTGMPGTLGEFDADGDPLWWEELYPERIQTHLRAKLFMKLNPKLSRIYRETIKSFNHGALILCTAGLRAVLEGICDDKRIKGKDLREKIENLQPLLPNKNIIKNLHHFRFTGNKAVHELKAPDREGTKLAIEVIEDLLNFFYELDYKVTRLRKSAKKRKKKGLIVSTSVTI